MRKSGLIIPHLTILIRSKVAACAKHYMGDGGTTEGINENNTVTSFNGLVSIHMPAYQDSIIKGVSTVMVSYSSWNGKKVHANKDLITGLLKNKLRFRVMKFIIVVLVSSNYVDAKFNPYKCQFSDLNVFVAMLAFTFLQVVTSLKSFSALMDHSNMD